MKFKKCKPIECTREEFDLVTKLCSTCSCLVSEVSTVRTALAVGTLTWECETKTITNIQLQEMAFRVVQAVKNRYQYLKIVD